MCCMYSVHLVPFQSMWHLLLPGDVDSLHRGIPVTRFIFLASFIRDVPDIRLYPDPAGYPATFHYPVSDLEPDLRVQKPDSETI